MPDYAACSAEQCSKKHCCARYLMEPTSTRQSFISPKVTPCAQFWDVLDGAPFEFTDYDPTPYCHACYSMTQKGCDCGPIAENN